MQSKTVLIPLPSFGCDPSEVAIPWKHITDRGHKVIFATPDGKPATTDPIMLTGKGLRIWKSILAARQDAVDAYRLMEENPDFLHPLKYMDVNNEDFDAIFLPGGHDKKVKEYLESVILQQLTVDSFNRDKPVAAICHGVVLVARSIDPTTNKSIIFDFKTTSLLKSQEMLGYNLTRLWMGNYYLTYPGLTVEDEVTSALSDPKNFKKGPPPLFRDDSQHLKRGFIVQDKNYLSARWPGDLYKITNAFIDLIEKE